MLSVVAEALSNQYEAVLCALNGCIDRCPPGLWDASVGECTYDQTVLHALIYADYYLGDDASFREQPYHRQNAEFFGDYEEFGDQPPRRHYSPADVQRYLAQVRQKASATFAAETLDALAAPCGFPWRKFSRLEMHLYNLRHLQDHVAQLSGRLEAEAGFSVIPWVGSRWHELPLLEA